ncbi:MAG TPA: hypothetical protein VMZ28_20425, partial [Kofleriaceae bacterium]|nr:hypothetical protein [Kofleriaceae bacterium]
TARGSAVTLGSQAAPLGSRAAGSRVGSRAGSTALSRAASRVGSRRASRAIVPEITGSLPKMSSKDPGLLVVLADLSGSMAGGFAGSQDVSKADALADVLNGVVGDFVDRNNVGGTIRPRLDVVLEGYNGGGSNPLFEGSLRGQEIVSIADLADNPSSEIDVDDGEGNMIPRPVWVNPTASGGTPMKTAFGKLQSTVAKWGRRPAGRHIVLGVHVSDGESTDGSPEAELSALAADVQAKGGELLMTNIHLSSSGGPSSGVVFPDDADAASFDDHGKLLFKMSSPVPAALAEKLGTKPGARMMAYNATVEQFAKVFEAGSSVAAQ